VYSLDDGSQTGGVSSFIDLGALTDQASAGFKYIFATTWPFLLTIIGALIGVKLVLWIKNQVFK